MTLGEEGCNSNGALARTVAWRCAGRLQYALEGNITMSGASVEWVGDFLKSDTPVETTLALSRTVKDAGGVYLIPAMNGLGAPYWYTEARGAIFGLTRTSTTGHLARAALDAIAHQVADVFEEMQKRAPAMAAVLYADGGASANSELMQLQADLLGRPVRRSKSPELSALGAAWMAGLGVGTWGSFAELAAMAPERDVFEPMLGAGPREAMREGWHRAVESTRSQAASVTAVREAEGSQDAAVSD
jgi:glycerol kinase